MAYHGRAEDFGKNKDFREQFDFVVSRAVASLPLLLEYCIPFVKVNGYFVSYKSKKYEEEIASASNAFNKLYSTLDFTDTFYINEEEERNLLFIKKINNTDMKYPRKAGKPKKNPL